MTQLRAGARHAGRLRLALFITAAVLVIEAVAGFVTGSLALVSDAAHMLTDAVGLGMALAAIGLANRGSRGSSHTFGLYRVEILAALANAVLLFFVSGYVIVDAVIRISGRPEVDGPAMVVVALFGLAANIVGYFLLRDGANESLNVHGAFLEVLADLVGSAGVVVAGLIVITTDWVYADPIVAAAIGLWIIPRTWKLAGASVRVLIEAAPKRIDVDALRGSLAQLPGVVDVHDLHVWTLTSEMEMASAHLMVADGTDAHAVLDQARVLLRDEFSVAHATLQVEPDNHEGCHEVHW